MTGFNLPPGCETHHIPGNRPEDEAEEQFWSALFERLDAAPEEIMSKLGDDFDVLNEEPWVTVILAARDVGWDTGFAEGRAEEQLAQAQAHTD